MTEPARRRVVVTGIGAVSPLGPTAEQSWEAICAARSGIGRISLFDASHLPSQIAGEVRDFDPIALLGAREARRTNRPTQLALVAAREAVAHAHLDAAREPERVGVCLGSILGGIGVVETVTRTLSGPGARHVSPFAASQALTDTAPASVATDLGVGGPNAAISTACAAGADALGHAALWIRQGLADAVVAGGTDAGVTETSVAMFSAMRAVSTRNDEPERASRPFDRDRDGFVPAEGAAVAILEDRDRALARGAPILAELLGYGTTADAYHITAPDPEGRGAIRCMELSLRDAGLPADEVDYINAHGSGTPLNDVIETRVIKAVLGDRARRTPISSTKSMSGHLLGAAGAFEALMAVLAIRDGIVPPTINLENPGDGCDLDYVPGKSRRTPVHVAMSNSFGFGGHNASLVLAAPGRP